MTSIGSTLSLGTIGQVAVNAHDIKRATAFYRDVLGMKFLFEAGNLAFFDCDGVRLMLDIPEDKQFDHPSSVLYFRVGDINSAVATLRSRGVTFFEGDPHIVAKMPDHDLWMGFFRDTEENIMALMSEVPRVG
jgi:catechol 2,3-dioxygenase-like lactoylglutathione lyase family enzyme